MNDTTDKQTVNETEDEPVEVYVSFVKSKSAYQAFMAHRKHQKFPPEAVIVLPADSWRQSDDQVKNKENDIQAKNNESDLDEKDANISEMTDQVSELSVREKGPSKENFRQLHVDMGLKIPLEHWRGTVRKVKNELEYILLKFPGNVSNADNRPNCLSNVEYEKRLVQTISTNCVGENFQALTILAPNYISKEMLHWMAPALKALRTLIIVNQLNSHIFYALPKFCPLVHMLRLTGLWDGDSKDEDVQKWPSLKILIFTHRFLNLKSDTDDGSKFRRFIELNPQLDILLLDGLIDDDLVRAIADNLLDLKVLKFSRINYDDFDTVLDNLIKINTLRSLSMTIDCAVQKDLITISQAADKLRQIKDLKLITLIQNYEPNVEVKEEFNHLTGFPVTEHRDCNCCNKKRVLNFNGVIPDVDVPEDLPVLVVAINTNSLSKTLDKSLEKDIFGLFDDMKLFFPNVIRMQILNDNEHTVFVCVFST